MREVGNCIAREVAKWGIAQMCLCKTTVMPKITTAGDLGHLRPQIAVRRGVEF